MAQRDSSAVMNSVIALLGADATLLGLMPNGVYEDLAAPGSTRFVIVSQVDADDEGILLGGMEHHWIEIEARALSTTRGDVRAAAVRVDELLEPDTGRSTLAIQGYKVIDIEREKPLRHREGDEVDAAIQWVRRGGQYRIDVIRGQ